MEQQGGASGLKLGKIVERAANGEPTPVENVGVDHRGLDVLMAEQLLDGPDVVAVFEQVGGKGVAEGVTAHRLVDTGQAGRLPHGSLRGTFSQMMAVKSYPWRSPDELRPLRLAQEVP
jgi:hypothetical protein